MKPWWRPCGAVLAGLSPEAAYLSRQNPKEQAARRPCSSWRWICALVGSISFSSVTRTQSRPLSPFLGGWGSLRLSLKPKKGTLLIPRLLLGLGDVPDCIASPVLRRVGGRHARFAHASLQSYLAPSDPLFRLLFFVQGVRRGSKIHEHPPPPKRATLTIV